ncbi:MAG: Gldg family protein [Alphaproteobacteria bacterium]|nr:Gldg family protein [Alphaproteobacteria bacterium]
MQQFKTLFQKELNGYFQSSFAYILLFIYLFVSIGSAFYFGSYLAMHDTAVYALFYLQPVVLTMVLPAITMRLWSEEYKSGTAEFLLTQPLKYTCPVLAKFCAAAALSGMMTLFLLPFVFYTASQMMLDWGNIVCCYVGLWLFICLFCALGCLISSLNKHIIAAYLLSVFVMALWMILPLTGLYEAYTDFLLAEISLYDLTYMILFCGVFLFLNVLVLEYRASAQRHKTRRFAGFAALLLVGAVLLNGTLSIVSAHKFDLTAHKIYTPQKVSQEIISAVDKPISIDVYIAKDFRAHNIEYFRYYHQVRRFLEKYQAQSDGLIRVNVLEVEPFSQMESAVLEYGLYYETNPNDTKDYFGAVVRDNDGNGVVIKKFTVERSAYLEKDIDGALLKLQYGKELSKSIGVYLDPTQNLDKFNAFMLNLEDDYDVVPVTDDVYEISPRLDLLILVNPKKFSAVFRYALDQYILNGGKAIILFDLLTKNQVDGVNMQPLGMIDFLDKWGILIGGKLVDAGEADAAYYTGELPVNIYRALEFAPINKKLTAKPIVKGTQNRYIGAVIEGVLPSLYAESPHKNAKIQKSMLPHSLISTGPVRVALIGDVDFVDEDFWLDERSADANPFTAINKAANMEIMRNLVDEMAGITAYRALPVRSSYRNTHSIGQQIYESTYGEIAPFYIKLNEQINEMKDEFYQNTGVNADQARASAQVNEIGQQIAALEKQADALLYRLKGQYSQVVRRIMLGNILLLPLCAVGVLWLIMRLLRRRKAKHIREIFNGR